MRYMHVCSTVKYDFGTEVSRLLPNCVQEYMMSYFIVEGGGGRACDFLFWPLDAYQLDKAHALPKEIPNSLIERLHSPL